MVTKKKVDIQELKTRTVLALELSQKLSKAQLTVGPLRYITAKQRQKLLREMVEEGVLQETILEGRGSTGRGCPPTRQYSLAKLSPASSLGK